MAAFYVEALERQMKLAEAQKSDWDATHNLAAGIQDNLMVTSLKIAEHEAMIVQRLVSILYCRCDQFHNRLTGVIARMG
jgi:hypothetical protein